jgi:hypothetical protein
MLEASRLNPPRNFHAAVASPSASAARAVSNRPFVSAEDFDGTGILTGIDPCASNYWWMPELYGPEMAIDGGLLAVTVPGTTDSSVSGPADSLRADRDQATRRTASRTTAAA